MIGSKSPLAYTEFYELTTIHDGIQYDYEIVRQLPAPTATLVNSFPTNKKSGTTVTVIVNEEDSLKLHKATIRQLIYFDNVLVTNELWFYDNHFKLINHDDFIVRSDKKYPFNNDMHIVIGQVAYPIDWALLGIKAIEVPVGIKFEIGDIPVTLDREKIHYANDEVKLKIIKRITDVKEVLKDLYLKSLNIDGIESYINLLDSPKTKIMLGGYEVYYGIRTKDVNYSFTYKGEQFSFKDKDNHVHLRAFEVLDLNKKEGSNRISKSLSYMLSWNEEFSYAKSKELNHWGTMYYKDKKYVRRVPLNRKMVRDYASLLGLTYETVRNGRITTDLVTGAIKKVFLYIKCLEETFAEKFKNYDHVPSQFIEDERAKQEALKEERKGNITFYDENNSKTVMQLKDLMDNYQYVFYISKDASQEERSAYMALYRSFDNSFNQITRFKHKPDKHPRILVACFAPSVINKIKNKTKELTITSKMEVNGKIQKISTTKKVYAFLSADKMFKYTELFSQFHKLRYASELRFHLFDDYSLSRVSKYYNSIGQTIPGTGRIISTNIGTEVIYPYLYFKDNIDAIVKKRNPIVEANFNLLLEKSYPLYLISKLEDSSERKSKIKQVIKTFKLTKLNSKYYGY